MDLIKHEEWVRGVVDKEHQIKIENIAINSWIVVPVESGSHFSDDDIRSIATAIGRTNSEKLLAITLEELAEEDGFFAFDADENGLSDFDEKYGHYNVALFPPDHSFLLVCTSDDFFLVAGEESFVTLALGTTVELAKREFQEFSSDPSWPNYIRSFLESVASRYA